MLPKVRENISHTIVVGRRPLLSCSDQENDLQLHGETKLCWTSSHKETFKRSDGIVKVFYLRSTTDLTLPISVVVLDLNHPSDGGSTYLALDSVVATTTLSSGPSVELRLDLGRPDGSGEARCKLFKGRSSARFLWLMGNGIDKEFFQVLHWL